MVTQPIAINQHMTRDELKKLKPKGARRVVLKVSDEKYPERERDANDIEDFVGINGEVIFKS